MLFWDEVMKSELQLLTVDVEIGGHNEHDSKLSQIDLEPHYEGLKGEKGE